MVKCLGVVVLAVSTELKNRLKSQLVHFNKNVDLVVAFAARLGEEYILIVYTLFDGKIWCVEKSDFVEMCAPFPRSRRWRVVSEYSNLCVSQLSSIQVRYIKWWDWQFLEQSLNDLFGWQAENNDKTKLAWLMIMTWHDSGELDIDKVRIVLRN